MAIGDDVWVLASYHNLPHDEAERRFASGMFSPADIETARSAYQRMLDWVPPES